MKIIKKQKKLFVIRVDPREDAMKVLLNICKEEKIHAGYFLGIGAVQEVEISWYSVHRKRYFNKVFKNDFEIVNFLGNISRKDKDIIIHAHASFADKNYKVFGGHVKRMVISATCEIIICAFSGVIQRSYDARTGLLLLKKYYE